MHSIQVRYLVRREKHNKKGDVHVYYYWMLPKSMQDRFRMGPYRLAENVPKGTSEDMVLNVAVREAEEWNAKLDGLRKAHGNKIDPVKVSGTFPWLWDDFQKNNRKFKSKSKGTQRFYTNLIKHILLWSERAGHPHVRVLKKSSCRRFIDALYEEDPISGFVKERTAYGVYQTLRRILNHAVDNDLIATNPAAKLQIPAPNARSVLWEKGQVLNFIKHAASRGRKSIAYAVWLANDIGQREGDILSLKKTDYNFEAHEFKIIQSKTGVMVEPPVLPDLHDALVQLSAENRSEHLIVNENTGEPYVSDTFRHDFRALMDELGYDSLWFMDLRRTAVVRLAEAGSTVPEIVSYTGHDIDDCAKIVQTYLPRNKKLAQNAHNRLPQDRNLSI